MTPQCVEARDRNVKAKRLTPIPARSGGLLLRDVDLGESPGIELKKVRLDPVTEDHSPSAH